MPDIASLVDLFGGMAQKQHLVSRGARDIDLTLAVKRGEVVRARQGWYTTLPQSDPAVRVVRVGGMTITIEGLHAIRPSARMLYFDWDRVLLGIQQALAARATPGGPGVVNGNSGDRSELARRTRANSSLPSPPPL